MRKGEWVGFYGPMLLTVFGIFIGLAINNPGPFLISAAALYGIGFLLFLKAKLSALRKGQLVSFGTANMNTTNIWFYRTGYSFMIIGALVLLLSLIGTVMHL